MKQGDVFVHGVASGDPLADRVIIWTRVTTDDDAVSVGWTVARDPDLKDVVASGETATGPDADHTVNVDVAGLQPGTHYWYAFEVSGRRSSVARTKTLPAPGCTHLRIASVSCAKFNAGFFNVYGRIADREDLDFVLHLGDYIYEASNTPPKSQTPGADIGRPFDPRHECVTLDDYRRRYAHYRRDPDAQRPDPDQWDGYPAERERLFAHMQTCGTIDLVVLSGDVDIAMANDLKMNPLDRTSGPSGSSS